MGVRTLQLPLLGIAVLSGALGQETPFKINGKLVWRGTPTLKQAPLGMGETESPGAAATEQR